MAAVRPVTKTVKGRRVSEGAGVRLLRTLGSPELGMLDPFLLLDEFRSDDPGDYIAGFPDHPHRGFETVTYMLAGQMEHADSEGHFGILKAGGVQWMTAGRGIVHSEMPRQEDGLMWGFQLWVNLPASGKMRPPRYQNIEPENVPLVKRDNGTMIKVIAGEADGVRGAVTGIATGLLYLDVSLPAGEEFSHVIPAGHASFAYVFDGEAEFGGTAVAHPALAVFGEGDEVRAKAGARGARFLLIAARRLNEPVARHGPFVMNTEDEIMQAFEDYRRGRL